MVQAHARELLNQKETKNDHSMANQAPHPLFAATERLAAALERLERNLQNVPHVQPQENGKHHDEVAFFEQENASLKVERTNLNTAIETLQNEYDDLHKVASAIYGKLDDSIKRLTKIIEN